MKKTFYATLSFLSLIANFSYASCDIDANRYTCASDWSLKARVAAFVPTNSTFQRIYGYCKPSYEVELSKVIYNQFELFGNINYYSIKGKSVGFHDSTRINNVNFSFGAKYNYYFTCKDQFYVGIGAAIADVWIKNHTNYSGRRASKGVFGGVLKLGVNHYFTDHFFVDLFADYYYQPVKFESSVDVGGLRAGLGLGYRF